MDTKQRAALGGIARGEALTAKERWAIAPVGGRAKRDETTKQADLDRLPEVAGRGLGAAVWVLYGIIPTYQPAHFGRVYAAYGGVFVVLSVLWGWRVEGIAPDRYDAAGALLCLVGVAIIMYAPRGH